MFITQSVGSKQPKKTKQHIHALPTSLIKSVSKMDYRGTVIETRGRCRTGNPLSSCNDVLWCLRQCRGSQSFDTNLIEKSTTCECNIFFLECLGFVLLYKWLFQWVERTSTDQSAEAYKALLAVLTVQYTLTVTA